MKSNLVLIIIFIIKPSFFLSQNISDDDKQFWYKKDFITNNISGLSYNKWFFQNRNQKKEQSIIVAVIDTQIDINHEDLKGQIWTNKKEIANNKIDDDKNGFVDDINGWNFLGTKSNNYVVWVNFECVRFVRRWQSTFKG